MNFFSSLAHKIATFFGSHQQAIQTGFQEAQAAVGAANAVATVLGEPLSVTAAIGKIGDGLKVASAAIAAEASATTLTQHAGNLSGLVTDLVTSGDIGIKNAATQTAVGVMAQKVAGVAGALEAAASIVTPTVQP